MSMRKTDLKLSEETLALIAADRDAAVSALRKQADKLATSSPLEYLAMGVSVYSLHSFELAGRLASRSIEHITWEDDSSTWRAVRTPGIPTYPTPEYLADILEGRKRE